VLSFKPALAVCALGIGAGAFGAAVYVSENPPEGPEPVAPAPRAEEQKAPPNPPAIELPAVIVLEPVTVIGRLRRPPVRATVALAETRLEPCSDWRELAVGPAERTVRGLCVAEVPADAPDTALR
jgi:hypothetical protein